MVKDRCSLVTFQQTRQRGTVSSFLPGSIREYRSTNGKTPENNVVHDVPPNGSVTAPGYGLGVQLTSRNAVHGTRHHRSLFRHARPRTPTSVERLYTCCPFYSYDLCQFCVFLPSRQFSSILGRIRGVFPLNY